MGSQVPNRILREAILGSEKMAALNWQEEVFYRRLMSIVDDYGRYEANPQLLRARCYPLQTDAVRAADITRWMAACQKSGLILCYEVSGKRYLELTNFQQQQRSASKYPPCNHLLSNEHLGVSVFGVVSEGVKSAPPDLFDSFWKAYPKKKAKDDAKKAFDERKPDKALLDLMLSAIAVQSKSDDWLKDAGKFIPYPATWLNDGRWQDEATAISTPKPGPDPMQAVFDARDREAAPIPQAIREQMAKLTNMVKQ